ncbi:serine hydrolase [Variovorax sp. J31P179]|uniref:serine hydrolase n=1 Tax=Variovorax sp. J31P179 TaxID=3053508 RepID=UPI0025778995|nr:serine hydrolase [Variovorax sp. J31P179]MDM0085069.1 serine hydrolase [Variovorax sp. J31P179]
MSACGGGGGATVFVPVSAPASGPVLGASPAQDVAVAIPPGQVDAAIAKLDDLAADIMHRSNIPGMAVAVVKDGKTVYAKGFGVRRMGSSEAVDADTVFQLASMSKPIGATVVAGLVSNDTVSWNTPVATLLPGFKLSDDWASQQVTIGDLYAHRSGLPEHAGDRLEDLGYDRRQVIERLRHVPLDGFRIKYAYTNFGLTAGAEAAATAAGQDWAALSERILYRPLGMTATSSRFADYMQRGNRTYPHVKQDGRYQALYQREPDAQSPAGGVSSSVNDLAHWMSLVLQDGSYQGLPVLKAEALLPAISAQIVNAPADSATARAGFYGYGFNVGTSSSGRVKLSHSGAFLLGAGTAFSMIPSAGVAIVTLTNASPVGAAEALNASFDDLVEFGKPTRDWYAAYSERMASLFALDGSLAGQPAPTQPAPALGNGAYTGRYANDYYGDAVVEVSGGGLLLRMGPTGTKIYALRHWSGNTFVFDLSGENAEPGSLSRIDFRPGAPGVSQSLQIEYYAEDVARGVFTLKP